MGEMKRRQLAMERFILEEQAKTGRACGDCSLCCKVLKIDELQKPKDQWCKDCLPGAGGCSIYDTRPTCCRTFACAWLIDPTLPEEWRPTRSKMVVRVAAPEKQGWLSCEVHVNSEFPDIWRSESYRRHLRALAYKGLAKPELRNSETRTYVFSRDNVYLILPDGDYDVTNKTHTVLRAGQHEWNVNFL